MKSNKVLVPLMLIFNIAVLIFTILDFMALHDIWHDYASPHIIAQFGLKSSQALPVWTKTTGEWGMVDFSLGSRFILSILFMLMMVFYMRKKTDTE
jgi:hypothetical protein